MKVSTRLKDASGNLLRRDSGGAIVEMAIVFPILLLLFVGTAEVGRLFYTYTTLAKATKLGARYLSNKKEITTGTQTERDALVLKAKSLVVCGYEDCTNKTSIVSGLSTANVNVTLPDTTQVITSVRVQITGYQYTRGVFTLAGVTGNNTLYFELKPGTTIRYMFSS
jgi:Flp pilus assembly protein TadG